MSTAVTFSAPGCVLVGGHRDLRSLGITDCPVTAMTVTHCDGRDITGGRYPPNGVSCNLSGLPRLPPRTGQHGAFIAPVLAITPGWGAVCAGMTAGKPGGSGLASSA